MAMETGVTNRRRLRANSQVVTSSAAQASEDGDYVQLSLVRERSQKLGKVKEEPDDVSRKVSQGDVIVETPRDAQARPTTGRVRKDIELLRQELFNATLNKTPREVGEVLSNIYSKLPRDTSLTDPVNRQNVLHHALGNNRREVAEYLIVQSNDEKMLLEDFDIIRPGLHGKKNALHQITELQDMNLAKLFLSKVTDSQKKKKVMLQEAPVEISGQRPRTFSCLHLAAFNGDTELVEFYLNEGLDVNQLNAKNDTSLLWAARWGHEKTVKTLLARGAGTEVENDKGSTALYWAVRYEHVGTVQLLLEHGKANPNKERKLGLVAPIVVAAAYGNNELVQLLLNNGADANVCIRGQERPIHHAAREGHLGVLETLIAKGAELNVQDERGDTALTLAAQSEHVPIVKTLVQHGADINHKNHDGHDAWVFAIKSDSNGVLKALVQASGQHAPVSASFVSLQDEIKTGKQQISRSPLCVAASLGACDKIEALLKLNVNPETKDEIGNAFLHYAAMNDQHEVVRNFHKKADIDAHNKNGMTPLHQACMRGHTNSVLALLECKAKANIKNKRGETALHVAAQSRHITPETVKALVEYTIKTHAWESLNAVDKAGNNALHLAGKLAEPDVLWEFRFVRIKDKDEDGNTPLHEAVRRGQPEALETMIDVYESMKRDADINEQNNKKESVLHLAVAEGFSETVPRLVLLGSDLSLQDEEGNTVLHRIVRASVEDSKNLNLHLEIFDTIIRESVRWWCIHNVVQYPDDNKPKYRDFQRQALLYLINDVRNKSDLSVLAYAFRICAPEITSRLLMMEHVTMFTLDRHVRFDITHITPMTNDSLVAGCCGNGKVTPSSASCIECMVQTNFPARACRLLNIPPMRHIERAYANLCAWTYLLLIVFHIGYMSVFTYVGLDLQTKLRDTTTPLASDDSSMILMYVIILIEPLLLIIWIVYATIKYTCMTDIAAKSKAVDAKGFERVLEFLSDFWGIFFSFVFAVLVIVWVATMSARYTYQDYFLAVSLCVGWIYTISFTRGFRIINYFWRMLLHMILRDVLRFLVVYFFVLLAFGFALHVVFQVSQAIVTSYSNIGDTLFLTFNMMVGMGELFDGTFEQEMANEGRTATFAKILYVIYIVLATIVLLNLLIAMMNDSYSYILAHHKVRWRVDSARLGVSIEKIIPFSSKLFSQFQNGNITGTDTTSKNGTRWFIEVPVKLYENQLREMETADQDIGLVASVMSKRMDEMEKKMRTSEQQSHERLDDIQQTLAELKTLVAHKAKKTKK